MDQKRRSQGECSGQQRTSGCMRRSSASISTSTLSFSTATGAGPTPDRRHISPQNAWSPKKGTAMVGQPAARPAAVVPDQAAHRLAQTCPLTSAALLLGVCSDAPGCMHR